MAERDDYSSVGFFNVFGIIVTMIIGFLFLFALMQTLVFTRKIIFKLRIIMKNSYIIEKASLGLPIDTGNRSEEYVERRDVFRREILRSWNLRFSNVYKYTLDRYNHLVYMLVCKKSRRSDKLNLLKPQFSFYLMIWFLPFFLVWIFAIFFVGTDLTISAGAAVGYAVLVAFLASFLSIALAFWFHYFWNK
jgi:hypothetical protein